MFDIWLTESTRIVKDIIDKSNLREAVESEIKSAISDNQIKDLIRKQVGQSVREFVEKYIEQTIEDYGDDFHPSLNEDDVKRAVVTVLLAKFGYKQ